MLDFRLFFKILNICVRRLIVIKKCSINENVVWKKKLICDKFFLIIERRKLYGVYWNVIFLKFMYIYIIFFKMNIKIF